jgi:hypothetical protein
LQATEFEYVRSRMNAMRDVRSDPNASLYVDGEYLRACIAPGVPNPRFNQVFVSGPAKPDDLASVLGMFDRHEMMPRFELSPAAVSGEIASFLAQRGFVHTQSDPVFVAEARELSPSAAPDVAVISVHSGRALEAFKDAYIRGWEIGDWLVPTLRSYIDRWPDADGWSLYLASYENAPIGIGVLFVHGEVAYLADAATAPEYRARGAQRALIHRRIVDSQLAGARLVFGRAEFGTTSQRNFERAGLPTRFTAAIWTKSATTGA